MGLEKYRVKKNEQEYTNLSVVANDDFRHHLLKCSAIVATWPKWKQELLGVQMEERKDG